VNNARRRLILFARFPVAGKVKTRLIPALGAEGAAALHRRLVLRTLRTACALCESQNVELEIRFTGGDANQMQHWLGDGWLCRSQDDGDLGQRMTGAFADSFREQSPATVIIGSDCPALTPGVLTAAFDFLHTRPVVFGPATDGGYYLVGLTKPIPELFQGIAWGAETVLARSLAILSRTGIEPGLLSSLDDLDRPEDLPAWRRIVESEDADLKRISVIIPALNEAAQIAATLQTVHSGSPTEIIVVDGGSKDDTRAVAKAAGAMVIQSLPGRARQMNAGATRASGSTVLFLHADTLLPRDYMGAVSQALHPPGVAAGAFQFRVAGAFAGKRLLEWTTNLRSRWRQMPYGDQGIFLRRSLFEELGGFADLPIMEDYEFVRRLRRHGRIITTTETAITSGRRWQWLGLIRSTLLNQQMILGYHLGWPLGKLAERYRQALHRSGRDGERR
jgi:uncharacterized protein